MRKRNSHNSRNGLDRGVSVPGAFKLDHLHPVNQFYFPNFTTFSLSYWRPILITPESGRLKMGKWNSPILSGISVAGAFKLEHLQPVEPILV